MYAFISPLALRSLTLVAIVASFAACGGDAPTQPLHKSPSGEQLAQSHNSGTDGTIVTLRQSTVRYQDINNALADGFVLLHECETRPDEGPVGTVYVNFARLMDGVIDARLPDALIYEPTRGGHLTLVGAEFAIPYPLWTSPDAPQFLGNAFQREDEFGVYALHAWVWRQNPNGLFAETNPRVSCAD